MDDNEMMGLDLPDAPNNWSMTIHVQIGEGGVQRSISSHRVDGLTNEMADQVAEAFIKDKVLGAIHEWQEFKKRGGPKKG